MIDVDQLEREVTGRFAEALGLEVDRDVFKRAIPDGVAEGAAIKITGQGAGTLDDVPWVTVQVLGKYAGKAKAWRLIEMMRELLPGYGWQTESFSFPDVQPQSDGNAPFDAVDRGVRKYYASVTIRMSVLTRQA